jgi:hypothetical protein
MALADIQKKGADERKREKRLVHMANALARDFLGSKPLQKKTKTAKEDAEDLIKSMLDYLFFQERKEIQEIQNKHIHDFMLAYTPNKLDLSANAGKTAPETIISFLLFLEENGHIKNGEPLREEVKNNKRSFLKLMPKVKKTTTPKKTLKKTTKSKAKQVREIDIKIGRNDPCPCGSGKKYKKCCGQPK